MRKESGGHLLSAVYEEGMWYNVCEARERDAVKWNRATLRDF